MAKTNISIEGYGNVKIDHPSEYNEETVSDLLATTVSEVLQLIDPRNKPEIVFHKVLGMIENE